MSPATCDFGPQQLKSLYDSKICFTIGHLPFEANHLYPILKEQKHLTIINHSANIDLLEGSCGHNHRVVNNDNTTYKHTEECEHSEHSEHNAECKHSKHNEGKCSFASVDPHIWTSPKITKTILSQILDCLNSKYPDKKDIFTNNYNTIIKQIDSIDNIAKNLFATKTNKNFMIYHPSLTYFANEYGLKQISIEKEGKEPKANHLKEIIDEAKAKNINLILVQNQFDKNNAYTIAGECNCQIVSIDPLAENWLKEFESLLDTFQKYLK